MEIFGWLQYISLKCSPNNRDSVIPQICCIYKVYELTSKLCKLGSLTGGLDPWRLRFKFRVLIKYIRKSPCTNLDSISGGEFSTIKSIYNLQYIGF